MPLACRDGDKTLYAFRFSREGWADLKRDRARLRMGCCDAGAVLKCSKYGTQFFAHARRGDCTTAPESAEHLLTKDVIARAIEAAGWTAYVEHRHPAGDWIADVLAERDGRRIAFEVQLSHQTIEETQQRHERYLADGIACVWLMRAPSGSSISTAPIFCVDVDDGAPVMTPSMQPLSAFVTAVLHGRQPIAGDGIDRLLALRRADQNRLSDIPKVKAVIAAAGETAGWSAAIDFQFEALERPYRHGYAVKKGEWSIPVLLSRGAERIAVHAGLGGEATWFREQRQRHYATAQICSISVDFVKATKSVLIRGDEGLRRVCYDADQLAATITEYLTFPHP